MSYFDILHSVDSRSSLSTYIRIRRIWLLSAIHYWRDGQLHIAITIHESFVRKLSIALGETDNLINFFTPIFVELWSNFLGYNHNAYYINYEVSP
jgi:hypothetical protein